MVATARFARSRTAEKSWDILVPSQAVEDEFGIVRDQQQRARRKGTAIAVIFLEYQTREKRGK